MSSRNNPILASTASETGKVIAHFRFGMEIGRGSFANVYKGVDLNNRNKTVAIKSVFRSRLKNDKLISNLEVEIKILRNLKNPHIVSLLDCVKTEEHIHLIMDYCSLGDLSYFIKKKTQLADHHPIVKTVLEKYPSPEGSDGLHEIIVINFIKQLASALKFLRSQNLIHRDIKPQNLLLCTPAHTKDEFVANNYSGFWELPILKVADFGFARYLPSTSMAETLCGSPLYMAPEILRYEKYNAKADLWSVGTVIYEMAVGRPPFRAANHIELLKKIERSNDEIHFPTTFEISQDLVRLICNLLKANPIDRMGFTEFFNDPIIVSNENLIESMNESISYSFENEEMYVSEFLVGKDKSKKETINRNAYKNDKKNDSKNEKNKSETNIPVQGNSSDNAKLTAKSEKNEEELQSFEKKLVGRTKKNSSEYASGAQGLKRQQPLNDLTIQEEDEYRKDETDGAHIKGNESMIKNGVDISNNMNNLKSVVSNGIVTKTATGNQIKSDNSNKPIDMLHKQQTARSGEFKGITLNKFKKNDLVVEKDYVVIEKRNVELNSFADEITKASKPMARHQSLNDYPSNDTSHSHKTASRRYSLSVSPSSALKEVLDYTSEKLFGATNGVGNNYTSSTSNKKRGNDERLGAGDQIENDDINKIVSNDNNLLKAQLSKNHMSTKSIKISNPRDDNDDDDNEVVYKIERLAMMAHSIILYAVVKFNQIIPLPPSSTYDENKTKELFQPFDYENNATGLLERSLTKNDKYEYNLAFKKFCQEGLVLYLKVLTLLGEAIKISSNWWSNNKFKSNINPKMGELIQWIRNRFNESLEKAEYLKLKINRLEEEEGRGTNDHGGSMDTHLRPENGDDDERFVCEKIIFDRAIEISKETAIKELKYATNEVLTQERIERLNECEGAYSISVWMLQSILYKSQSGAENGQNNEEDDEVLNLDDQKIVENFINSIGTRLLILKDKLDRIGKK